jgi:hypothetical protein
MTKKVIQKKGVTHLSQIQLFGSEEKIGEETVTVYLRDQEGNVLLAAGTTVPTAGTAGYAKSALFIKTNAASGTKGLYENQGTVDACNFNLVGAIETAEIADGAVRKSKVGYKSVAVTVAAGQTSGSSSADAELVGGEILGYYPTGNQDQLVDNVVLNANGSVTITLAAAATSDNTFKVVVLRA